MGRTERLFRLANLLRDRTRLRFDEMQERLGVSPATLKRDIKYLREQLGAPVRYDAFDRTYQMAEAQRRVRQEMPGVWFSEPELYALLLAHRLLSDIDPQGQLAPRLSDLARRVQGLLGSNEAQADFVQRVKLIAPGRREVDAACFAAVTRAMSQRRRLRLAYFTRSRRTGAERDVSPQRLVYHRTWYLDAWCHRAQALRRFALDAVESAQLLDEAALEMPLQEIERLLDGGYGSFSGEPDRWAVLVFSADVAQWVEREAWHAMQRTRRLHDGRLELMLPYQDPTELVMDILRHGENVEVMGDTGLREAVAARARATAAVYG